MARKRAKKNGRPTKYRKEFCEQLIKFFDIEPWEEREIPHYDKSGNKDEEGNRIVIWTDIKIIPARMPTLRGFAKKIGVNIRVVYRWIEKGNAVYKKEFSHAFTHAKEIRKDWLIDLGLSGSAPPASFKFVAVNVTDMRDQQEVVHSFDWRTLTKDGSDIDTNERTVKAAS